MCLRVLPRPALRLKFCLLLLKLVTGGLVPTASASGHCPCIHTKTCSESMYFTSAETCRFFMCSVYSEKDWLEVCLLEAKLFLLIILGWTLSAWSVMAFIIFWTEFSSGMRSSFPRSEGSMHGLRWASFSFSLASKKSLNYLQNIIKGAWLAFAAYALGFKDSSVFCLEGAWGCRLALISCGSASMCLVNTLSRLSWHSSNLLSVPAASPSCSSVYSSWVT